MSDSQLPAQTVEPLVQALRQGDRQAFAQFVEEYSPFVYRLGLRLLQDPQDAEDVLQETFIKAFKHLPGFDGRSKLSTWLYRIATNEALMLLRKRRPEAISVEAPGGEEDGDLPEPLEIVDWGALPEQELLSSETRRTLGQAVESLPASLRLVFQLREVEGLSTSETAQVLNLSEAAVKTRLSRARLGLREILSAYYSERISSR